MKSTAERLAQRRRSAHPRTLLSASSSFVGPFAEHQGRGAKRCSDRCRGSSELRCLILLRNHLPYYLFMLFTNLQLKPK